MVEVIEIAIWASSTAVVAAGSGVAIARRNNRIRAAKLPSNYQTWKLVNRLPMRHRIEAHRIVAIAREHDKRHVLHRLDAFTARETLRSYLPETIYAYLAVPESLRSRARNGHPSPDDECAHQLYMLRVGLEKVRDADGDVAMARMRENKTFLHDRFGTPPPPQAGRQLPPILAMLNDKLTAFLKGA
jgi:hypothetical protein